jgi:hypothetical protein
VFPWKIKEIASQKLVTLSRPLHPRIHRAYGHLASLQVDNENVFSTTLGCTVSTGGRRHEIKKKERFLFFAFPATDRNWFWTARIAISLHA